MTIDFEQQYIAVRKKENRIYSDFEVLRLPETGAGHEYSKEWIVRKRSAERLITYLKGKNRHLAVLEVGCGNGWLCNQMSKIHNSEVLGLDINLEEVMQANRVFKGDNLGFIYGQFNTEIFEGLKFDCIVFAASIQYFPSLKQIITDSLSLLADQGEIHIIDTYFYPLKEQEHAANRSTDYYNSMGFPEMAEFYYHHTYDELKPFRYKIVSTLWRIVSSWFRGQRNFEWIIIKA